MISTSAANPYRMSFSTGGLFLNESVALAGLYEELSDWTAVKSAALEKGSLPFRKASSSRRSIREIVNRLAYLSERELELLRSGGRSRAHSIKPTSDRKSTRLHSSH